MSITDRMADELRGAYDSIDSFAAEAGVEIRCDRSVLKEYEAGAPNDFVRESHITKAQSKLGWALFNHGKGNCRSATFLIISALEELDAAQGTDYASDWKARS